MEAAKMSFHRWIYTQTAIYPDNRILFSNKTKWAIKPLKHMREANAYDSLKRLQWDSNYITFSLEQNYKTVKRSVLPGLKVWGWGIGGGWTGGAQRILRAVKLLCAIPDIKHLLQPIKLLNPKIIPNVNHGLSWQ